MKIIMLQNRAIIVLGGEQKQKIAEAIDQKSPPGLIFRGDQIIGEGGLRGPICEEHYRVDKLNLATCIIRFDEIDNDVPMELEICAKAEDLDATVNAIKPAFGLIFLTEMPNVVVNTTTEAETKLFLKMAKASGWTMFENDEIDPENARSYWINECYRTCFEVNNPVSHSRIAYYEKIGKTVITFADFLEAQGFTESLASIGMPIDEEAPKKRLPLFEYLVEDGSGNSGEGDIRAADSKEARRILQESWAVVRYVRKKN